jgi:hypothetical protein
MPLLPLRLRHRLWHSTKNPTRLSTESGLCKGPDTQRSLSVSHIRQAWKSKDRDRTELSNSNDRGHWDRSTEANTRVIVTYEMVSRGTIFALSTTSGQGMDICIE